MSDNLLDNGIQQQLEKAAALAGLTPQKAILVGLQLLAREQNPAWRKRPQITDELYIQSNFAGDTREELTYAEKYDGGSIFVRRLKKGETPIGPVYVAWIGLNDEPPFVIYDIKIVPSRKDLPLWMENTPPANYLPFSIKSVVYVPRRHFVCRLLIPANSMVAVSTTATQLYF